MEDQKNLYENLRLGEYLEKKSTRTTLHWDKLVPEEDFRRVKRHVFDPLRSFFTHGKGVPFLFNKIECFLLFFFATCP